MFTAALSYPDLVVLLNLGCQVLTWVPTAPAQSVVKDYSDRSVEEGRMARAIMSESDPFNLRNGSEIESFWMDSRGKEVNQV
jgi:hypothetical protein